MVKCEFCDKELSTNSSLKLHQTKTKYCLEKQKALNISVSITSVLCAYCGKDFIHKHRKDIHENNCTERIKSEYQSKNDENINLKKELTHMKESYEKEIAHMKESYEKEIAHMKESYEKEIAHMKESYEKEIAHMKEENNKTKSDIYAELYNKDQQFILEQSKRLVEKAGTITTNIKAKNITMNSLNLSQERLESIKDTYTIKHYERGGVGQADWVVDNVIRDDSGTLIYKCTDKNRKNFIYHDDKGNIVTDIQAKRLKEAILPIMSTKLKEFKKIKCAELAEQSDDESELLEKYSNLYNENKAMGNEFDKRLIEKTYDK
ncbi:MAG: hypothetical protein PHG66_04815 [Candidatus Colwellbacteria bacterium]|nr:hypothetical protein [Candidatus Colwellbacteria bacterium]